jgi:hypothetical protein
MIDSSIAMGYRPVQINNPMNQLAQLLQIQQAQKQGQLADLNMQTAQRGFDEQNKLRDYFAKGNFDSPDFVRGLYSISPDKAMAYDKTRLDSQKDLAEIEFKKASTAKTNADVVDSKLKQSRLFLDQVQTPEQYMAWHEGNHADPVLGPILKARGVTADSARAQIEQALAQPGGFQQLLQRSALGLEKFTELNKPTYQTQNTGDRTTLLALPGLGGAPTTISSAAINQSPDNAATVANAALTANMRDETTRSEGALNRIVTVAGQNKLDARARELNQITADNKPLTEGQSKSALFGSRMMMANKIFDTLEQAGTTTSTPGINTGYGVGSLVNALSSANQQQLMQAKRDFLNAVLRRESGAVIGESEFVNGEKQYFPQVGDTKQVITQKRANREAAMRGVLVDVPERRRAEIVKEITGAAPGLPGAPGSANLLPSLPPADSSNRGKRARDTETGKVYKSNGTTWMEE